MGYIKQQHLPGLKQYKYAGVDRSLVSKYILKPFYSNVVIKCFPMSMAPNAITLIGFLFVVANFLTLLWYNPTLDQNCPPWVYATWTAGLFMYQTFDAVDGSQARRTRQSGPLGELFDHGVDACNTVLEAFLFAGATNLGRSWETIACVFASLFTFYVQTWDEYYTETLTLGIISGPVEGILTLCIVYAITAKTGASFWHQPMLSTLHVPKAPFMSDIVYDLPFTSWYMIYGAAVLLFNTGGSILNVVHSQRRRNRSVVRALFGLLPAFEMWTIISAYLNLEPDVMNRHIFPFILYVGLINAYVVGQMIVAHLVKTEFPHKNILLFPLAMGAIDSLGPKYGWYETSFITDHAVYVWMCFGLALGVYGSFVHDVITSICEYLDIWCLTIKHPYVPQESEKAQ